MMDPSGTHNFEDQWRKALGDASETPPPLVWSNIEARLDQEDNNTVIPLWWQSRKLWYAAASVAAILLVAGLWFANPPQSSEQVIANAKTAKPSQSASENENLASSKTPKVEENAVTQPGIASDKIAARIEGESIAAANATTTRSKLNAGSERSALKSNADQVTGNQENPVALTTEPEVSSISSNDHAAVASVTSNETANAISAEMLAALPYSDLDVNIQKRYVFYRPENKVEEVTKPSTPKEYYAGVGLMPAAFNPDVKIRQAPDAFAYQALANRKAVSGSSETGVGYAIQTNGGMRLSKHWSLEMGVSYLKGNSAYQGSGYVMSAYNSQAANALENALAGIAAPSMTNGDMEIPAKTANGAKNEFLSNSAVYIDVAKKVANNYQYLQLPFQAGFTLNPDRKLSYSVIGGVMANFFLANELESASGEIITTRASDEVYRSLNWAATTGLRFNYKLSSKWKANLTGSYQKAVSSGFRSNQSLEAHPFLYGVSWGVRYSF